MELRLRSAASRLLLAPALATAAAAPALAQGFDVQLVVDAAVQGFTTLDPLVGINDEGSIAFTAVEAQGSSVYVWRGGQVIQLAPFVAGRQYLGAAINDAPIPEVAARDRDTGPQFSVKKWPADGSMASTDIGDSPSDFDSATNFVDINDLGFVSFPGLIIGQVADTFLFFGDSEPPVPLLQFNGNQSLRPALSDDNFIVYRDPQGAVVLVDVNAPVPASVSAGHGNLGRAPGISPAGATVAFTGDAGNGPGVFVSIDTPLGREIVPIAGDALGDGFTAFDGDQRAGVVTSGTLANGLTVSVVFAGTRGGIAGVYRTNLSAQFQGGQFTSSLFAPARVLQVGDTVDLRTISDFDLYHPLNRNASVAFHVDFAGGGSGIVLAQGDRDGDSLLDVWEVSGIDVDSDGQVDFDLPALGADPDHKDIYVEVDAMNGFAPSQTALDAVEAAFAAAPVSNPDSTSGIRLHLIRDEMTVPPGAWTTVDADGWPTQFDSTKTAFFGTSPEHGNAKLLQGKRMAFRYCVIIDEFGDSGATGVAERPGNDFIVCKGQFSALFNDEKQSGTLMHELGHTLGLQHGGGDSLTYKPNYFSVMNYTWQFPDLQTQALWTLDYSRSTLPSIDELAVDEGAGFGVPSTPLVLIGPPPGDLVVGTGPVDLDGDGQTTNPGVARDLNHIIDDPNEIPVLGDQLHGHDDWANLVYDFRSTNDFLDGVHASAASVVELDAVTTALLEQVYPAPGTYCTAKVNSLGCTPLIGHTGTPALSGADDFFLTATDLRNKKFGILVWSLAPAASPFAGGTLCVHAPLLRVPVLSSGGSTSGSDCTGSYSTHFDQAYMTSSGLVAGNAVFAQFWSRDANALDPEGIGLTAGLCFVVRP